MFSMPRIKRLINRLRKNIWWLITKELQESQDRIIDDAAEHRDRLAQYIAAQRYLEVSDKAYNSEINRHEFKVYSQTGEDGILLYIFSKIGTTNHRFVEFGCGDGRECNTANLSINCGWNGLLMDGNEENIGIAKKFYQSKLGDRYSNVKIQRNWITTENINKLILDNDVGGEIDLLSIDIDGNDYWIWKVIDVINPRVVAIEYNAAMGIDEAITVKYEPDFDRFRKHPSGVYFGASLLALTELAKTKGYILAGCCSCGFKAFFVRRDVAGEKIAELDVEKAYYPFYPELPFNQTRYLGLDYV